MQVSLPVAIGLPRDNSKRTTDVAVCGLLTRAAIAHGLY